MLLNKRFVILCFLLIGCFATKTIAENSSKNIGIVVGDPWFGLRYEINRNIGTELRYTFDPEIKVLSLRGDYKLYKRIFCGLEYGTISFDYEDISGNGYSLTPFFGYKQPITKRIAFMLDLGISYIKLSSDGDSLGGLVSLY